MKPIPNTDWLPRDENLSGMAQLLDARQIGTIIARHASLAGDRLLDCTVEYVRYKPQTNCLATYRVHARGDDGMIRESMFFGKCYTAADFELAVTKIEAKGNSRGAYSAAPLFFSDYRIIIDEMKSDPHLEGLETLLDPRKLRRLFYEWLPEYSPSAWRISYKQLQIAYVRYKPEKRAVVRFNTTATHLHTGAKRAIEAYGRCYCDDRGRELFRLMSALHSEFVNDASTTVPRPCAYSDEKRLLLVEGVAGTALFDVLAEKDRRQAIERTARALHRLNSIRSIDLAQRDAKSLISDAESTAAAIRSILPERARIVDRIVTTLGANLRSASGVCDFVHGDFHHGQLLLQPDKEVLLDFDRSYCGDALADIGNFCAHLRVLEFDGRIEGAQSAESQFVADYERIGGAPLNRDALAYWTALGLLLLAVRPFRTLRPNWRSEVAAILELCLKVLP